MLLSKLPRTQRPFPGAEQLVQEMMERLQARGPYVDPLPTIPDHGQVLPLEVTGSDRADPTADLIRKLNMHN